MESRPELLAPAGDWDCLRAAVANGADAVYFGLPKFNARIRATNFTESDLPSVIEFLHGHGVKGFVTFNTLIFTAEIAAAVEQLHVLDEGGVDAIIVQDLGLARLARDLAPGLAVHASTQMTLTSPEGVRFVSELGARRVVLARELSLREIARFDGSVPVEVFVHGALCVAYSGQCLTSEALGQRSANRGECAQACRLPYELIVDGALRDLGDRRYLLSPQDLAAVNEIPDLIRLGVSSFKIEGRLKSPEYVAAVTRVYRKAIDAALEGREEALKEEDHYALEMTFSRGLFTGWMHGVDHQKLVSARFGKKRGPLAGRVVRVGPDWAEVEPATPLARGDGIVFDTGGDTDHEQGGRIYDIRGRRLFFKRHHLDFRKIKAGDRVWKTDDPALNERLRRTYRGRIERKQPRIPLAMEVSGAAGQPLRVRATVPDREPVIVESELLLETAQRCPLTAERLREHLGRLSDSPYELSRLDLQLVDEVILPIRELNRLRREVVAGLDRPRRTAETSEQTLPAILSEISRGTPRPSPEQPALSVLCRTMEQVEAVVRKGVKTLYLDFEDIRRYGDGVAAVRAVSGARVYLATPRIQKAGEQGFFRLIENAGPDGVLIRNLGAIDHFRGGPLSLIGDFSLNVANPVTAGYLMRFGLERLTISYDLNIEQVLDLVRSVPEGWFELTLHQHMPMFHMEHCVFAAFLSKGKDYTDCGRPCETHRVHLRDRVGMEHPLRADVGCRNTLFNAVPQSGARFFADLRRAGLRHYRVELLEESPDEAVELIAQYQALLRGDHAGEQLWKTLKATSQLGVTRGTW